MLFRVYDLFKKQNTQYITLIKDFEDRFSTAKYSDLSVGLIKESSWIICMLIQDMRDRFSTIKYVVRELKL